MGVMSTAAVGLALGLDTAAAEFPEPVHPVALFGRLIGLLDREWTSPTLVGLLVAAVLPAGAAAVAGLTTWFAAEVRPAIGVTVAGCWLFATTSRRMLTSTAGDVVERSATDPDSARGAAPALVGRDPDELSPGELRSAAVESAAENLADGLVAPLLAFALGAGLSLPAAAAAAALVKAVNTLDSMLGYRTKPVGRASARLDDAIMWLPARASAALLAVAGRDPGAPVRAREWRRAPASPNSGWPMATLAAALDVRLTKPDAYVLNAGADLPTVDEARSGIRVVGVAGGLAFLIAGVVAWV